MDLPFPCRFCLLCSIFPSANHKLLHSVHTARRDILVQERATATSSTRETKSFAAPAHLVSFVTDLTAKGLSSDVGHHMALQERRGTEDFGAGRAGVVLPGVGFMDMLAVLLQGGKAHPTFLAVIGIFDVCCPETQQKPQGAKKSRKKIKELRIHREREEKAKKSL